ncbi:cytochrome c peroxidase [Cytophagaceae bacterium DM2B3-1]|uniref:Cytochrome c peroxidase n=1 Tax=Xanthocytophaga flava TaxID=3048013 RepID=A0ABT7CHG5_9BACT|nr:cytochrome c peroxidase [Xanthocytophaga flavus]MDJ1470709.1 cytochrome c peroxidase [Xanthocytophaga flavus]MDJ1493107.1 cytochrome c peroxidase [Xanthocytophaga flavus]
MKPLPFRIVQLYCVLVCINSMLLGSCSDQPKVKPVDPYALNVPANFPDPVFAFKDNLITKEGFELGRLLFYEPRLSRTGTVSCGTCHRQMFAFADHGHDVSHGINDKLGFRNTPAIQNLAFQSEFFWDGGVSHIDLVPLNAIENTQEMDETLVSILQKLNTNPTYKKQFKTVFNTDTITSDLMLRALAQFTGLLISSNSRYDNYIRHEHGVEFTKEEKAGLQLFKQKCASCHTTDLFTDHSYRNNGLDEIPTDYGRELITGNSTDKGKFKVPSLRNVERTSPYMHDGRFRTLQSVLNHYTSGVKISPTLDPLLTQNEQMGIPVTENEKKKIIAFLKTLTDPTFLVDKRFVDPLGTSDQK